MPKLLPSVIKGIQKKLLTTALLLVTGLLLASVSRAANFPVTTGADAGAGSLRAAITAANAAGPGPHTITFSVTGTITVTTSLPAITVPGVTIDGGGTVTLSGPAATNNYVALITLNAGANNATIKGLTLQNTGVQPITINGALSGVTLEDLRLRQTGADYMNHGIYVGAASTNMTIRNVIITDVEKGNMWALRFRAAVSGLNIDGFRVFNSGANHLSSGNGIRGIQFEGTVTNFNIKNSTIDLDAPGSTDDGNYGIYCNTTVNGFTMDSVVVRDAEVYHLFFGAGATNVNLNRVVFDNLDGYYTNRLVQFNSGVNIVNIDSCVFDADYRNTTNDADNLIWFNNNMQRVSITNSSFIEADIDGIYAINGYNNDNITITGNTFLRNGTGSTIHAAIHFTDIRNTSSDGGPILISENTFRDNNGVSIYVRPTNGTTYVIPNFTISKNIITGSKVWGGIKVNYIDKIIITENSIYNNVGRGIDLSDATGANCAYEGANTPQILSSAETSPGSGAYNISVKMPAICGTNNCKLELFSSPAGTSGIGGMHYVDSFRIGSGIRTLSNVTKPFPEIVGAPYGFWTATLKVYNNCGTSEFSNKMFIKPNGPAGISAGIALWLRGEDLTVGGSEPTASGQVIGGWEEFSGGGGPSSQLIVNDPRTKLAGINFNPVADMDNDVIRGIHTGATTWLSTSASTTVSVFNPLNLAASDGDRYFVLFSQAGVDYNTNKAKIEFYRNGSNNITSYRGNQALAPAITGLTGVKALDRPGLFSATSSATSHTGYYNGVQMGITNASKGAYAISQWFVGGGWGPNASGANTWQYFSNTDFAETFTYNRVLTDDEMQRVSSYMALKYAIPYKKNYLLSNGTMVWDVAANATYSKQIAALARDNISVLHQKQAKSFHVDEPITIALGSAIAAANKDITDTITNNLSTFIWGNDSASTALTQAFATGTFSNTRMTRVWKVQKTNWADADITIKLNGGKDNNFLLISTDPAFATLQQELKLNKDGTITVNTSLFPNGAYFTFGRQQRAPGGVLNQLDVWVKADEGVTGPATAVTAVEDQSASQRKWPKVNRPEAIPLSYNAINYNAAFMFKDSSYFVLPQFTQTYTQGEVFSVQSSTSDVAGYPFQLGGNGQGVLSHYRYSNSNQYTHWGTNARKNFSYGTKNLALPAIMNLNTLSNSWTASFDGKVYATAAYPTHFPQYVNGSNAIGVGYGSYFNGPVSEVIQYKRKLTATERLQVNSYLALRFGITLDQTTPTNYLASNGIATMWNAADNTGYINNIAGIGRDDNGALLQKQSRSINNTASGNLIAIAAGDELALSNEANTDTITNDRSFLVWADNAGAVTYTTAVAGTNVTLRMPRVWKVDKTNWADRNITLKLFGSAANTYLLISNTDAGFGTISQELQLNPDSTIIINTSLLPDGAYFTFGKQLIGPGFVNNSIRFWLRADDTKSVPSAWYDYSGNDNNAIQNVVASQPVAVASSVNFNPAFDLDGVNDYLDFATNGGVNGTNPITIVSVTKRAAAGGSDEIIGQNTDANGSLSYGHSTNNKFGIGATNVGALYTTGTYSVPNVPFINSATRGPAANQFSLNTNGVADGGGTGAYTFLTNNLRVGHRGGAIVDWFNGDIAELVLYNKPLTAAELLKVNSYLGLKYGITLNNGTTDYIATDDTTKIWSVSKNPGYNRNIAGIGRDDKTALYQKQSRSVSDSTITIALGVQVAADNLSNTEAIDDDLSFFTWADNGGAVTYTVPVSSGGEATMRMVRVWKVDRTNWTDKEVTFKVLPGGERFLLVHATDPAFGAGTLEFPININTGSVTVNTSNLPDGAYFTLATKITGPGCVNSNILTWLRADYGATGGADWVDFSGKMNTVTQPTVANRAALVTSGLNFNPALNFGGTHWFNIPTIYNANDSITAFFISRTDNATAAWLTLAEFGEDRPGLYWNVGGPNEWVQTANPTTSQHTKKFSTSNAALFTFTLPNSNPKNYKVGANGLEQTFTGSAGAFTIGAGATGSRLGGLVTDNSQDNFDGYISEVVFYRGVVTDADKQRVHSYLALKYGITLDQTTPTNYIGSDASTMMWTAADNIGYNRRITGIGRDDCTNLYQKQSLSMDTGHLTLALGDIVQASNAANTYTIDSNNSYFVFADNGADTVFNMELSGIEDLTIRMPRTWKVDKTRWADADVSFKLKGGNDRVYLIVSTDETFDASDVTYQLNDTGLVTLPSADIPDGAYFTFAKEIYGPGYVNNGIMMWLRADDGVSTVDTWNDYSGADKHATQATAASQPVFADVSVNYNPGFTFNGTATWMATSSTPATAFVSNSYFVVNKPATITGGREFLSAASSASSFMEFQQANATFRYFESTPTTIVTSPAASVAINVPYLAGLTQTTGTNNTKLFSNGGNVTTGTIGLSMPAGASTFELGRRHITIGAAANFFQGDMNEVAAYNRILARHELARVNSYLSIKHGLTYGTGDSNYVATDWDGTAGTVYWTADPVFTNNIAGIGRDDKTGLLQKQSRSVNTANNGNMVAMALTNLEATNKDNTNTFTDDLSFLVWADSGTTARKFTEYPAALDPGGCSKVTRLQREWKVQVTGNVSDVQLTMYLAGLVPSSTGAADLKLLIDDDGDFASGATTIVDPSGYDATTQTVRFDGLTFANNQYFTLVTDVTNQAPGGVLPTLYTWYRADKGVSTATGVSGWADQSVSGKDLTQATAASQPAYSTTTNLINFNPTLVFDGSNDMMANTTISHNASTAGEDFYAVVLPNTVAGNNVALSLNTAASSTNTTQLRFGANTLQYLSRNATAPQTLANTVTTPGLVQLTNATRTNAGAARLLWNGSQVASGTLNLFSAQNYLTMGALRESNAFSAYFNGRIAEVAMYQSSLHDTNRVKVESYFAIKYGITLTHNYVDPSSNVQWNVITNTGYNNNITGIGRDDCNGLHQKQSKSVNAAEAMVTLGNGEGIFATNADNANNMENNTALLLGDDNGNRTTWTATNAPAGRERIARVWKVQRTGNIGSVTIQVPASTSAATVKLPVERNTTAYLLVSGTTDFTAPVEVAMTLNGDNWEASYPFTGGEYFTFATNNECVAAEAVLITYGTEAIAPVDKCYEDGWILFKDPAQPGKYLAAIYDPTALIDRTKITAKVDVNGAFAGLGKGDANSAIRLMRRMVQIDCAACFDAGANPTPGFVVRMFYSPTEKSDAENVETNNIESIKTANSLTAPHLFEWFKAEGKTVDQVISGLTADGINATGQQWSEGSLLTGQVNGIDYVDFTDINAFSTFGGAWIVNLQSPLPVEWLDVTAAPVDDHTIGVKWGTATELNNAGFDVERSDDGVTFHSIAKVPGKGNSNSQNWYAVNDKEVKQGVKYFYRIKQTDFDGRHTWSRIVTAMLKGEGMLVTVMPNPVRTVLQTEIFIDRGQTLQLQLTDIGGKVLNTQTVTAQNGKNIYRTDMMRYSNGTYFMKVITTDGSVITKKVIVQKGI